MHIRAALERYFTNHYSFIYDALKIFLGVNITDERK